MSAFAKYWVTCAIAALAVAFCMSLPEPAHAQFGFSIGGLPFRLHFGPSYRGRYYGRRSYRRGAPRERSSSESEEKTERPSKESSDKILASLGAPSSAQQSQVLKTISASAVLGVVGSTKDLQDVGKPTSKEEDRDYTGALDDIIRRLAGAQDKGLATPGDVTASGIELSLSRAIKDSNLDAFERFASESWTSERIRKLVLDRTLIELGSLLSGNTRGNVRMDALDGKIQDAAKAVYRRIFETSELLAANRAANQFIQRLYQATSARVEPRTLEIADTLVRRGSSATLAKFNTLVRTDDNSYTYQYRAQRIMYDCLSANIEMISKNEREATDATAAIPPSAETIEQRIKRLSLDKNGCHGWLAAQFGDPDAKIKTIKAQKPYPMRVVWSQDGPIEDPSMYSRSANKL